MSDYTLSEQAVCFAAERIANRIVDAASQWDLPSVIYRPRLFIDGDKWCALYGDNIQDGVAGFGSSPAAAVHDFNCNWHQCLKG